MARRIVLLIEDNPGDADLTRRAFAKARVGTELVVAEDGQEALDFFSNSGIFAESREQLPALTLLDLKLPRISGVEVLRRLRAAERTRRLPVVVLTSSLQQRDLAECYDLGANSYVRKPVDFERFVEVAGQLSSYWLRVNEPPPVPGIARGFP